MASYMYDAAGDQLASAAALVKCDFAGLQPLGLAKLIMARLIDFTRRHWVWLIYFVVMRKMFRMLMRFIRRAPKAKWRHTKAARSDSDNSSNSYPSSVTGTLEKGTFFSHTADITPLTNQVIVGDGVIVINRNDRYVEVYERKNVARADNVDAQVEALLKEFTSRNQRR